MAFRLEVRFSGLCLFAQRGPGVRVLLPDARRTHPTSWFVAPDGSTLRPHAGYVSFPLAALDGSAHPGPGDGVIRLDGTRIAFETGGKGHALDAGGLEDVAQFRNFAPRLKVSEDALADGPHPYKLGHVVVERGRFTDPDLSPTPWVFSRQLADANHSRVLARAITLEIGEVDSAVLALSPLDGQGPERRIALRPPGRRRSVRVTVANLCDNPLEWPELPVGTGDVDSDFKWYYHLMQEPQEGWAGVLRGHHLPVPTKPLGVRGSLSTCILGGTNGKG